MFLLFRSKLLLRKLSTLCREKRVYQNSFKHAVWNILFCNVNITTSMIRIQLRLRMGHGDVRLFSWLRVMKMEKSFSYFIRFAPMPSNLTCLLLFKSSHTAIAQGTYRIRFLYISSSACVGVYQLLFTTCYRMFSTISFEHDWMRIGNVHGAA